MSFTNQDLVKLSELITGIVQQETKIIPEMRERLFKIEDSIVEVKDIIVGFRQKYDEDYGFFGLGQTDLYERMGRSESDIKLIKRKLNLG